MHIYFARHGESQANIVHEVSNRGLRHGLTSTGRQQAYELAQKLQETGISYIYSSPILRAVETSIAVAHHFGLNYEVTDALREYDCGRIEGRSDEEAWQQWKALFDAWTIEQGYTRRIEGGESFYDVRDRFVPFIEELIERYKGSDTKLLCIAHGGIYHMMLPLILRNVDRKLIEQHGFGYTTLIITELDEQGLVCVEWNGVKIRGAGEGEG